MWRDKDDKQTERWKQMWDNYAKKNKKKTN